MKKKVLAILFFSFGFIFIVCALFIAKFDFNKLFFDNYHEYEEKITENVEKIEIDDNTFSYEVKYHSEEYILIVYNISDNEIYNSNLDNKTLKIETYMKMNFFFAFYKNPCVTLYLPLDSALDYNYKTKTGNIKFTNIKANNISLNYGTGNINLNNVEFTNLFVKGTTGNLNISNSKIEKLESKITTGNVKINNSNLDNVKFEQSTGNIRIDNSALKNVNATLTSGNLKFNDVTCWNIYSKTSTGNIRITLLGNKDDYKILCSAKTGDCNVSSKHEGIYDINLETNSGNIKLYFK